MPPEETKEEQRPLGFLFTLERIYEIVGETSQKLDDEVSRLKTVISRLQAQLAAQWVVQGIMLAVITFLVQEGIKR